MKRTILGVLAIAFLLAACNNAGQPSQAGPDSVSQEHTSTAAADSAPVTALTPQFSGLDSKVATSLKMVVDQYLHIKNGLADDNSADAANGGRAMAEALAGVNPSLLTPEQQKVFTDNADDLKEHAEHIGKNEGNIAHQREHFAAMSEDVYALVKAYGGGRPLYHDYCPMYDNNKGALWLSEEKNVKNPYMAGMTSCGSVKEMIK
ncbi:DUF3347 domain-containing protein [Chitinophaga eiseniae]|uniref:DUF3347 domain-containing protein n=1 Tax=Chitinophaga eiseniae TaxID=634771 RepID=A0A847S821_9BACT|nr:DUF3347 domain-containing protein [Chitinophaga eiseniae]NLR77941.1 DUF3347 domain-containing protein [Chitinophaga eiseniae]